MRRLAFFVLCAACSSPTSAPRLRHLDRPGDVSFGCVARAVVDGVTITVAVPPASCSGVSPSAPDGGVAVDAGGAGSFQLMAFILEPVRGDVSVVANVGLNDFVDSDKFAPGLNGLPVGRLPTSIATSSDGCSVVVANSGSCDLSLLNVVKALQSRSDAVQLLPIKAGDRVLLARPTMVTTRDAPASSTPSSCAMPSGTVYVSFEGCHLVARVDLATGQIIDGVQSLSGQQPTIVGPDVVCPDECNALPAPAARPQEADAAAEDASAADASASDAGGVDAGPPPPSLPVRPSALALEPDGTRIYAGAIDSPALLTIDLDETGRPSAMRVTPVEGTGGITRLAATGEIEMGDRGAAGLFRFVYAIATDGAIHVIDVTPTRAPRECDTQIDRRYLRGLGNRERLSCFPVGEPNNPPRRAGARGPGIRLPHDVLPLDVTFIKGTRSLAGANVAQPIPALLFGTFAVVTANGPVSDARLGRGLAYIVNVDDDNYPDVEGNSEDNDVALAIPHALRDGNTNRRIGVAGCDEPVLTNGNAGPVRVSSDLRQGGFVYADTGQPGDPFAPGLHRVICDENHAPYELGVTSPAELRQTLFPDLEKAAVRSVAPGTPSDEAIVVSWEGTLTFDELQSQRRGGRLTKVDNSRINLEAPGAFLCGLGAADGDIVRLVGCNGDFDCAGGEACVTHPDAPPGVNGVCVLDKNASDVALRCRSLLISLRRYTAAEVYQDHALLLARPAVLPSSPVDGCTDDAQCKAIENALLIKVEIAGGVAEQSLPRHNYACEEDPGIGGVPLCIASCVTDSDCDTGSVCAGERCVLGAIPPAECLAALQRFEIRAGNSFVVQSTQASFGHRQIVEPGTGRCIEDVTRSPLIANRIHRLEPECTDLSVTGVSLNPCRIPELTEPYRDPETSTYLPRPAYGMRIRSAGLSFDITDVAFSLTEVDGAMVSNVPSGFGFRFNLAGGFVPFTFTLQAALPARVRLAPDGVVWIVDSGDSGGGLVLGQLLYLQDVGLGELRLR